MRRIYLAANYSRMHEMCEFAAQLREAGHEVTSRWIDGMEEGQPPQYGARMGLADIDFADIVMSFTLPPKTLNIGGGRHFEMGYGYCAGKRMMIVGVKGEIIFHYLPSVEHFETFEEALKAI